MRRSLFMTFLVVALLTCTGGIRDVVRNQVMTRKVATSINAPGPMSASGTGAVLQLSGSAVPNAVSYKLYRGYGADKTLIDEQAGYAFDVVDNVLGAPQYYQVQAVGAGGVISGFSEEHEYWPVSPVTLRSPTYMLMQWRDYADGAVLSQATIDSMATYDAISFTPHFYECDGAVELAYGTKIGGNDIVTRVRAKATATDGHNVAFLTYLFGNAARLDWGPTITSHPTLGPQGPYPSSGCYTRNDVHPKIWDWCAANDGFLTEINTSNPLFNPVYPVYNYNYGNLAAAEAIAQIHVEGFSGSALDGEYCGFLYDFINADVQSWTVDRAKVDLDRDGAAYTSSPAETAEEAAIYRNWHLHLVKSIRKEFAMRGMSNRLIVVNGNGVQSSAISPSYYGEVSQWVDGFMEERWNDGSVGYPGWRSSTDLTAAWTGVTTDYVNPARFPKAQTRPYAFIWHCYANTELPFMSAIPALYTNGWAHANDPGVHGSCSIPGSDACWVRGCNGEKRISEPLERLPDPGALISKRLGEMAYAAPATFCDTLTVVFENLKGRLALRPYATTKGSWPYIYTQKGADGYYETADDVLLYKHSSWPDPAVLVASSGGTSTWANNTSHTITGSGFGATKTGLCKVEIGNSPYYATCTVKEAQTTTAWGATSITLTYSTTISGAGWLYAMDSTGGTSLAYKITRSTSGTSPVAAFSGAPTTGAAPLTVNFTDASTNTPTGWSWNFGDSGTSSAQNPSHQYANDGAYTVTLTASNAYGSDAEVKTSYISVSSGGGGTPAISGFTGTMTHGTAVTINGADFGSKSPAAPLKWEDFEGHTNGADVLIADGWNDAVFAKYSSAATYAGTLGMHCDFSLSTNVSVRFDHAWTSEIYIDVKQRFIPSSTPTRNYKPMLLYGSCNHGLPDDNEFPQVHLYSENTCTWDGSLKTESRGGLGVSDSEYLASANGLMGSMHHMQTYMKLSTPGVADGKIFHWLDCVNRSDRTNVLNRDGVHAAEYWKQLRIGYYFAHDAIDGCPAPVGSGGAYYDDVYIDSTQARVEIGNASSYDACTFREIQIPTSWSSTQIQVTFNAGAFAQDDPAWIFVIDSNGAKSAGYFGTVQE